jgi:hypothetical protein
VIDDDGVEEIVGGGTGVVLVMLGFGCATSMSIAHSRNTSAKYSQ